MRNTERFASGLLIVGGPELRIVLLVGMRWTMLHVAGMEAIYMKCEY